MSSLQASMNAFRGELSSSASRVSNQRRTVAAQSVVPTPRSSTPSAGNNDLKRKRHESSQSIVYSQPADTDTGKSLMTQTFYVVDYLKGKDKPVTFDDIWRHLSIQGADAQTYRHMLHIIKEHAKVEYTPKSGSQPESFRFRPIHDVRSSDELLRYLKRQPTAQGISVKELKDGWPGAVKAIEQLEEEGKILVTRNRKDDTPRMVWSNDLPGGSKINTKIDTDFQAMWQKIRLPPSETELRKELEKAGLVPTSRIKEVMKSTGKKERKKTARRGGRTTNTHMAGVLRDYSDRRK
ncbi:hypothetical protein B0A49_09837 [Cryomyces minteri]|uniref:Transcription initiation factor IIE subunit beta n=2 Tax=Cryomyces minteri TaxID=331657 RepID=A0A4V5NHG8_9PEZI|nr:hypothetical protein B0A49_09563 [Cryomyces minteri]TKA72893.1 hypothetical protein B0A49_09837 [Cryomyces minteri]